MQRVTLRTKIITGIVAGVTVVSLTACSAKDTTSTASATSVQTTQLADLLDDTTDVGADNPDPFDLSQSHEVALDIDQDAIDTMLEDYQSGDEKTWVKANITIDGTTIENVGVRLKGNSSLRILGGNSGMPGGGQALGENADGQASAGMLTDMPTPPEGMQMPTDGEMPTPPDGGQGGPGHAPQGGGMSGSSIDESDVTTWPLLISFDKYEDGRVYQGMSQLSLRSGIPSLNEATALSATAETGQASQRYTYLTYSVNGGETLTRIALENPDEYYAARLGDGILYKADSESSFTYQGDDPETYADQFKIESKDDDAENEQPIVDLLKWMDAADDTEFDEHLENYVDVDFFAKYLATQNLLVNGDDMSGPGKNYYLWYDNETKKISVVSWDLDMSMQNTAEQSPDESASMGGGHRQQAQPSDAATSTTADAAATQTADIQLAADTSESTTADKQDNRGGMMSGNELKTRFLASEKFKAVYDQAYWDLYEQIYGSGFAEKTLENLRSQVPATDGTPQSDIGSAADKLQEFITQRKDYLATQKA